MKDADRYIWLLANMGAVEDEAKMWNPARGKPLLLHLQDFIDREVQKTGKDWIARQRELLKGGMKTTNRGAFEMHIESMKPAETAEEMRVEMMRICRHDPMVYYLMRLADEKGFSGEERYVILAYHALRELAALKKTYYDVIMSRPADPPVLLSNLDGSLSWGSGK